MHLADEAVRQGRPDRAARYGELAWRVKTTYQLRSTPIDKRRCRACGAFLSGRTMRVRVRDGIRVTTCLACGATRRRPLRSRKASKDDEGGRDEGALRGPTPDHGRRGGR